MIAQSLMVHAKVLEAYIHFKLIYTTDHILPVLTIKDLINEDGDLTTSFKISTGMKPSIFYLCVLFCSCIVRKATEHVGTKALDMHHQAQWGFCGILVGIPQNQKWSIVYVPHKPKIVFSYNVVFDENFSSALMYMQKPSVETMDM